MKTTSLILALGLAACDRATPGNSERDSAGITIVESSGVGDDVDAWQVSAEPVLTIGTDSGSAYLFNDITGVFGVGNRIVVLNANPPELRVFDSAGQHVRSVGGRGQGPGEFSRPREMSRYRGDSLVVHDGFGMKLSVFDVEQGFARSLPAPRVRHTPLAQHTSDIATLIGALPSGDMVFTLPERIAGTTATGPGDVLIVRISSDGARTDTMAVTKGRDRALSPGGGPSRPREYLFSGRARGAVSDTRVFVTRARENEIAGFGPSGAAVLLVRDQRPARPVTADLMKRYEATLRATLRPDMDNPDVEALIRQRIEQTPIPDSVAGYWDLRTDLAGNLWARHVSVQGTDTAFVLFSVFDARGRLIGDVKIPPELLVYDIGDDYILGVHYDSLGVQTVRKHALVKPRY